MKFKPSNLSLGEMIAVVGGIILGISLFIAWYATDATNPNSMIDGAHTGTFSAWSVHPILRFLFLAAAAAPLILAWIVMREHQLSWPRGQVTSVVAIAAIGLIGYQGVIQRPGEPSSTISLKLGWFLALLGAILMLVGSFMRQSETEVKRKPPGVL
jgi:CDP-diglyceride synthetase